jgi:Flp pilus assembly protein TadG
MNTETRSDPAIEAAARALFASEQESDADRELAARYWDRADIEDATLDRSHYRDQARAALTAAAQVWQEDPDLIAAREARHAMDGDGLCNYRCEGCDWRYAHVGVGNPDDVAWRKFGQAHPDPHSQPVQQ